ncbi:hypothetical protein ACEWY4_003879 [Coilia grayii]|uniref:DUF5641 domain-containing protein n=1 Tax=Coilia grayii TaxID=363190 RepID=A0ABD1KK39_9TELE
MGQAGFGKCSLPHRNGAAEAAVRVAKRALQSLSMSTFRRASHSSDFKSFNFNNYPYKRLREIQTQVNEFWKAWCQLVGPNLFVRTKWHTTERNVTVGDVVWLCDQNALRGQFKLGRVVTLAPDSKGIVRDVEILVTPGNCALVGHQEPETQSSVSQLDRKERSNGVILRRDVRRLVVLLAVEEQSL